MRRHCLDEEQVHRSITEWGEMNTNQIYKSKEGASFSPTSNLEYSVQLKGCYRHLV